MQRLFFALPLSDQDKSAIARWRQELLALGVFDRQLKLVKPENFHITLAFLGLIDETTRDKLSLQAGAIRCRPFNLTINHTGHFLRPKVAYLGVKHTPRALSHLAETLKGQAKRADIRMDNFAYTPHLTLFRKARKPLPKVKFDFTLCFKHFALFESRSSDTGVIYTERQRWPLSQQVGLTV